MECTGEEGKDISLELPVELIPPSCGAIVKLLERGAPPVPENQEFVLAKFLLATTGKGRQGWESLFILSAVVDSFLGAS